MSMREGLMRRMGDRIGRVLRAVRAEHQDATREEVALLAAAVDDDGRVYLFEPVGGLSIRQVEALASAYMRLAATLRNPEVEFVSGRQAPPILSVVLGNVLRHALGTSAAFVGVYAEGPCDAGGNVATVLADILPGAPSGYMMRCLARASASLAIATNVDRPGSGVAVAPENTTMDILARGSRVLAMHAEASARSAAEAQINAGIPIVRRVGAVEEES